MSRIVSLGTLTKQKNQEIRGKTVGRGEHQN